MSWNGARVNGIFTCHDKGLPMLSRQEVRALEGKGLEGDRYASDNGAFSRAKSQTIRDLSLVSIEAIRESNIVALIEFTPAETRRNIVTEGVDLNELVGVGFWVGDVALLGTELCTPCARPSKLADKPGFKEAFEARGGLRAQILTSGLIAVGDSIRLKA